MGRRSSADSDSSDSPIVPQLTDAERLAIEAK